MAQEGKEKEEVGLRRIAFLAAAAWFFLSGAVWIDLPGVYVDEAYFASALFPDAPGGSPHRIDLFGTEVVIMSQSYLGVLKAWIWAPIVALFGSSAATLRLPALAFGAATVFLLALVAERLFDSRTAVAAALLAATDPAFLLTTRMDWGPVVLQRFFLLLAVWLLLRFDAGGRGRDLFAASAALGLGLYDKLSFHWLLLALAITAAVVARRRIVAHASPRTLALALAGFMLGSSPYWVYRAYAQVESTSLAFETEPHRYVEKAWMLQKSLNGSVAPDWMFETSAEYVAESRGLLDDAVEGVHRIPGVSALDRTLALPALAACALLLPWTLRGRFARPLGFTLLYCLIAIALMLPLRSAGSIHHLVLIHPFPALFVAASFFSVVNRLGGGPVTSNLARVAVLVLVVANVVCLAGQYRQGLRFGGRPLWSEAVYELREQLDQQPDAPVVVVDWGIDGALRFLTSGRKSIRPLPMPWDWSDAAIAQLERDLASEKTRYVVFAEERDRAFPEGFERLHSVVDRLGKTLVVEQRIRDRQRRAIYDILRAEPN